jgi:CRISPR-associated protein (TIGR03986 family)
MIPKHIRTVPDFLPDSKGDPIPRKAVAPYNFVELPDRIVEAQELPGGDRYYPNKDVELPRHTGKIECKLTTSSPLYTRCGLSPEDFASFGDKTNDKLSPQECQKRANFFSNPSTQRPAISGSSLRGMFRTLVEVVGYGKLDKVADSQLVYRVVGDTTSLGERYRERLSRKNRHDEYTFLMKAGYMVQRGSEWSIQPARPIVENESFARIERDTVQGILASLKAWHNSRNAYQIKVTVNPVTLHPHNRNRVKLRYAKAKPAQASSKDSEFNGVLVKTGQMPNKHMEFVFGIPDDQASLIDISKELVQNYKEQITAKQQEILGNNAALQHMQPVFYLIEDGNLVFFGHAMMFRLPYKASVRQFIPPQLRSAEKSTDPEVTDLAEAIFGYVRTQKREKDQARSGRVFFTDAACTTEGEDFWLMGDPEKTLKPKILGSPKPTTIQHYLIQSNETKAHPKELKHYASQPLQETVLRGHKFYWHKGSDPKLEFIPPKKVIGSPNKNFDTQTTLIKPIKQGVTFKFDVYFENLNDVELGALLWLLAIAQDEKYRLSLGMGKPLGMGAVKITHELYLNQRKERYEKLFDGQEWCAGYGSAPNATKQYVDVFDEYIRIAIGATESSLKEVRRIKMLLAMLSWDEAPPSEQTRYLEIGCDPTKTACIVQPQKDQKTANEYAVRPVLPTPLQIMGWNDGRDDDNNPDTGNSGGGNNPKPNPQNPRGSDRPKPKPSNSSSNQVGKTAMELALERAQKKPKRK